MIYEATDQNINVKFFVEPLLIGFEGKFLIEQKSENLINTYACNPITNDDEWELIKCLLFETTRKLAQLANPNLNITKELWKEFFYSKQLEFNFGV